MLRAVKSAGRIAARRAEERRRAGGHACALSGAEPMQVVKYDEGQMYTAHYDNKQGCVRRAATFMMYLSDVDAGGDALPEGDADDGARFRRRERRRRREAGGENLAQTRTSRVFLERWRAWKIRESARGGTDRRGREVDRHEVATGGRGGGRRRGGDTAAEDARDAETR